MSVAIHPSPQKLDPRTESLSEFLQRIILFPLIEGVVRTSLKSNASDQSPYLLKQRVLYHLGHQAQLATSQKCLAAVISSEGHFYTADKSRCAVYESKWPILTIIEAFEHFNIHHNLTDEPVIDPSSATNRNHPLFSTVGLMFGHLLRYASSRTSSFLRSHKDK